MVGPMAELLKVGGPSAEGRTSHRSAVWLRSLLDAAVDAVIAIDAKGSVQFVNPAALALFGWSEPELLGHNVTRLMPEPYASQHDRHLQAYFRDGKRTAVGVVRRVHARKRDGTVFPVELSVSEVRDGDAISFIGILRDVSERDLLRETVEAGATLEAALQQMGEGFVAVDTQGTVLAVNPAAVEITGNPLVVGSGYDWPSDFRFYDTAGAAIARTDMPMFRALRGESLRDRDIVVRRPDGTQSVLQVTAGPFRNSEGKPLGATAVFRDVTRARLMERRLEEQHRRAEESSQRKTRMLAAISQEVRAPLNNVVILSHLLRRNLRHRLTSDAVQCLDGMEAGIKSASELLRDLLSIAKIESGTQSAERVVFPLTTLIDECLEAARAAAEERKLFLLSDPGPLEGLVLATDRAKLKQILNHLLANAVAYTREGGVYVRGRREFGRLFLDVQDTGMGIPEDERERLFDEYQRVGKIGGRTLGQGSGLSLAVARRLAHLLGGDLTCDSIVGSGSIFSVTLPDSAVAPAGKAEPVEVVDAPDAIVEDS